ncbi:MAG: hypothetical protein EXR92_03645 [Gemmatimonadetes bacterium]|nr:hypothetical protein [Gemmatimonadota bacterium]
MKTVVAFLTTLLFWPSICQAQVIQVEITEVPYEAPYVFMGLQYAFGGNQAVERKSDGASVAAPLVGYSLRIQGAHDTDFQAEMELGYRKIDLDGFNGSEGLSFTDFDLGGRYYPRYPTFGLGSRIAVRLTGSALGGLSYSGDKSTYNVLGQEILSDGSFGTAVRI